MAVYTIIVLVRALTGRPMGYPVLEGPVHARLDARRDAALRGQPGLARLGRRARHPHGLRAGPTSLRLALQSSRILLLAGYLGWTVQILWR